MSRRGCRIVKVRTMTDDFGSQNYFIETLDKDFMVLTYTESEVQDGDSHTMYIVMKMQRM